MLVRSVCPRGACRVLGRGTGTRRCRGLPEPWRPRGTLMSPSPRRPPAGLLPPGALRAAGRAAVPRREDPAGGAAAVPRGEDGHHPEEGVGRQPQRGQRRPCRPQLGLAPPLPLPNTTTGDGGRKTGHWTRDPPPRAWGRTLRHRVWGGTRVCRHTPASAGRTWRGVLLAPGWGPTGRAGPHSPSRPNKRNGPLHRGPVPSSQPGGVGHDERGGGGGEVGQPP